MKKSPVSIHYFFSFILIIMGFSFYAFASFWTEWTEYPGNPVLDPASGVRAYYPSVIYDQNRFSGHGNAAYYKMWFASPDSGVGGIAYAYSDDGINWTEYNNSLPLSGLNADANHAAVLYDAGGFGGGAFYYKTWYWNSAAGLNSIGAIRYAESVDGITWQNDQPIQQHSTIQALQLVDGVSGSYFYHCYGPGSLIYNPAATNEGSATPDDKSDDSPMTYRCVMYYDTSGEGFSPGGSIEQGALAYSTDGIYWIRHGNQPVLLPSGSQNDWDGWYTYRACVVRIGPEYHMWYSGANGDNSIGTYYAHGIGHAVSSDGLNWTKDPDNPVFHVTDGVGWRNVRTYTPGVLYDADHFSGHGESSGWKMWFTGLTGSNYTIGYAGISDELPVAVLDCTSTVFVGEELCLDGSASFDPDGDTIGEYTWSLSAIPADSSAAMSPTDAEQSCFTPDLPGTYTVSLRVASVNGGGETTPSEEVTCVVSTQDQPPAAAFDCIPGGNIGEELCFDGSASSDPDGEEIIQYSWNLAARPAGSSAVMSPTDAAQGCFTPDLPGTYTVSLRVASVNTNNEIVWSAARTCRITTQARSPVAVFECITEGEVGKEACFNGSASYDPDGEEIVHYSWNLAARPAGSSAAMSPTDAAQSCFTPDVPGTYTIALVVVSENAGKQRVQSLEVTVEVTPRDRPPQAVFRCTPGGAVGEKLCFDGDLSFDPNGEEIVAYEWGLSKSPRNSSAKMYPENAARSCFTPDSDGTYVVSLKAASGTISGETTWSPVVSCEISIEDRIPTAAFTCVSTGKVGETICFDASASYDPDGTGITGYAWSISSKPFGSQVELSAQQTSNVCFLPDMEGINIIALEVTSQNGSRETARSEKVECSIHIQGYTYCFCPEVVLNVERLEDRMWHKIYRIERLNWTTTCAAPCCEIEKYGIYRMENENWQLITEVDAHTNSFELKDVVEWHEYKVVPFLPDNRECSGRIELPTKKKTDRERRIEAKWGK